MMTLGELAVMYPVNGGYYEYSVRFLDPSWLVTTLLPSRTRMALPSPPFLIFLPLDPEADEMNLIGETRWVGHMLLVGCLPCMPTPSPRTLSIVQY